MNALETRDEEEHHDIKPASKHVEERSSDSMLSIRSFRPSTEYEKKIGELSNTLCAIEEGLTTARARLNELQGISKCQQSVDRRQIIDNEVCKLKKYCENPRAILQKPVRSRFPDPDFRYTTSININNSLQNLLRSPMATQSTQLARLLSRSKEPPDLKSFNIMISRLSRLRLNQAAWAVFQTMVKAGISPDQFTLSSLLNLAIVSGSYLDFRKVLLAARMQTRLKKAGAIHFDRRRGLVLFSTIIKGYVKFGKLKIAETYLLLMKAERVKPNAEIYTCLLLGYIERGKYIPALPHLRRLMDREWDQKAYLTLLKFARATNDTTLGLKIQSEAKTRGIPHTTRFIKQKGLNIPNHMKHFPA